MPRVSSMLHVPDVEATADWYRAVGFELLDLGRECDGEPAIFAMLGFGDSRVLLSAGGHVGAGGRRDADLYVEVDDVEEMAARLGGPVDIVEPLHDSFYGMREIIVRDPNGFWITFAQPLG